MKKVGIITHYYQSTNYGGCLQAYAMAKVVEDLGYQAEQICYPTSYKSYRKVQNMGIARRILKNGPRWLFGALKRRVLRKLGDKIEKKERVRARRKQAFVGFVEGKIPHSSKVYTAETVGECVNDYDIFLTGSDQVWNVNWYNPAFFLDFAPSEKRKISYAASISMDNLSGEEKSIFQKHLQDFAAVGVREKRAEELLQDLSPVPPTTVLDPTLLLTKEEWDKVCSKRLIEEKYVVCYFLGNNKKERKIAKKFAQKYGLTLVTIPYASGREIWMTDKKFGGKQMIEASPEDFLSLIKHAEYVFTDSFHAVVFSNVYQKQYFVFNRSARGEMSVRITNITEIFGTSERFCAGKKENLAYVESLTDIDYTQENTRLEEWKEHSFTYLKTALGEVV